MPGVTVGQAVDFLEGEAKESCRPASATTIWPTPANMCRKGNQLAITFGFALIIIFLVLAAQFEKPARFPW